MIQQSIHSWADDEGESEKDYSIYVNKKKWLSMIYIDWLADSSDKSLILIYFSFFW